MLNVLLSYALYHITQCSMLEVVLHWRNIKHKEDTLFSKHGDSLICSHFTHFLFDFFFSAVFKHFFSPDTFLLEFFPFFQKMSVKNSKQIFQGRRRQDQNDYIFTAVELSKYISVICINTSIISINLTDTQPQRGARKRKFCDDFSCFCVVNLPSPPTPPPPTPHSFDTQQIFLKGPPTHHCHYPTNSFDTQQIFLKGLWTDVDG